MNKNPETSLRVPVAGLAVDARSLSSLPRSMKVALRGRYDKAEDDSSMDNVIAELTPAEKVRQCAAWKLGDPYWADIIAGWMKASGAKPEDF